MITAIEIQTRLAAMGFYKGKLDGITGSQTRTAIVAALDALGDCMAGEHPVQAVVKADPFDANTRILINELEREEGRVLSAYTDKLGFLTIGIGRLIDKRKGGGITNAEADYLKANDIRRIQAALDADYPEWRTWSPVRQRAFQNMAFQLGTAWPKEWPNTYAKVRAQDWEGAAQDMEKSLWAREQTPARAARVIAQWRNG